MLNLNKTNLIVGIATCFKLTGCFMRGCASQVILHSACIQGTVQLLLANPHKAMAFLHIKELSILGAIKVKLLSVDSWV